MEDKRTLAHSLADVPTLLLHRVRLAICVLLISNDSPISFMELKALLEETDGSLSTHLRKLEEGGYIKAEKSFVARKPLTVYEITEIGRKDVKKHLLLMHELHKKIG